ILLDVEHLVVEEQRRLGFEEHPGSGVGTEDLVPLLRGRSDRQSELSTGFGLLPHREPQSRGILTVLRGQDADRLSGSVSHGEHVDVSLRLLTAAIPTVGPMSGIRRPHVVSLVGLHFHHFTHVFVVPRLHSAAATTRRSATNSAYACSRSLSRARNTADGCTVATAKGGSSNPGSFKTSPRWALTRKSASNSACAAVAPSSPTTSGRTASSSANNHGLHAVIWERVGFLCKRRLRFPSRVKRKCFTALVTYTVSRSSPATPNARHRVRDQ